MNVGSNFKDESQKLFGESFPKILTVARFDKKKNHQNILICIRNLKEKFPKIKYISVGDGEEKSTVIICEGIKITKPSDFFRQNKPRVKGFFNTKL